MTKLENESLEALLTSSFNSLHDFLQKILRILKNCIFPPFNKMLVQRRQLYTNSMFEKYIFKNGVDVSFFYRFFFEWVVSFENK